MLENEVTLLRRFARTGDAGAFSEVVQRHAGLVYGACLRILADRDRAADAVQDTFFQLLRNAGNISSSVPAWLHRVATRRAIDVVRRDSLRKRREAEYSANKPREVRKWQDISGYVDEGLSELDEQTQAILIQHFFEGRSMSDIAAGEGISQPTVSRRIESGVAKLRERLRKRGIIVAVATLGGLLGENVVEAAPAIVLKELGKMALVGGTTAAGTGVGSAAAASGAGAKAAVGVLAGVKVKVVTAAVVTAVGVGSVVTYNHVTQPSEVNQPAGQQSTQPFRQRPSRKTPVTIQSRPTVRKARTAEEADWSEWEMMMEMIMAEDTTAAPPDKSVSEPRGLEQSDSDTPEYGFVGGYDGDRIGGVSPPVPDKENESEDSNTPVMGMGYGAYYGTGYGAYRVKRPEAPNSPDDNSPENRP
jgi:RNA polymerase sigma factor (sigma-70 family)